MLAALGWLIAMIGFMGVAGCVVRGISLHFRALADPSLKSEMEQKFIATFAASFGFIFAGILGAILLQVSGAYDSPH